MTELNITSLYVLLLLYKCAPDSFTTMIKHKGFEMDTLPILLSGEIPELEDEGYICGLWQRDDNLTYLKYQVFLTPLGKKTVEALTPLLKVDICIIEDHTSNFSIVAYYMKKLAIEELPKYLTHDYMKIRVLATKILKEVDK